MSSVVLYSTVLLQWPHSLEMELPATTEVWDAVRGLYAANKHSSVRD